METHIEVATSGRSAFRSPIDVRRLHGQPSVTLEPNTMFEFDSEAVYLTTELRPEKPLLLILFDANQNVVESHPIFPNRHKGFFKMLFWCKSCVCLEFDEVVARALRSPKRRVRLVED